MPTEEQLRAALAALGLPVPAALEHDDEALRIAALAAHLRRSTEAASYNLFRSIDLDTAVEAAAVTHPASWPVQEDHALTALGHLGRADSHLGVLALDFTAPDATVVITDDGSREEGFAAAAVRLLDAVGDTIRLRALPEGIKDDDLVQQALEHLHEGERLLTEALNRREAALADEP